MANRVTVFAACAHCGYDVQVTDDDVDATMSLLRRIMVTHLIELHPRGTAMQLRDVFLVKEPGAVYG